MINSIDIKNFETHVNTSIDLHPGVTVLVGESDEGKSGIIRAIKWNARNRPKGDSYRNDQLDPKKKEDKLKATEVGIVYGDSGLVVRARDGFAGGINHYQIDNEEPLRALRMDVPDEVQEITKMKDVNIQGQHPTEQYFLLADNPGQVAKKFNEVAGLTVMDDAIKSINSQVRTCNTEITISKKEIESLEEELKDTEWVLKAEKFAKKLESFQKKLEKTKGELEVISSAITLIENIDTKLQKYNGIEDAKIALGVLDKQRQSIKDKENKLSKVTDLISSLVKVDLSLQECNDIEDAKIALGNLKTQRAAIVSKENKIILIHDLIADMKSVDVALESSRDTTQALEALKELKTKRKKINEDKERIEKINSLLLKIKTNEEQLEIVGMDLIELQRERDVIREDEDCPTCGRSGKSLILK